MKLRQEALVFAGTVLVLGAMGYGLFGGGPGTLRGGAKGGGEEGLRHFLAPDPARALPAGGAPPLARALFVPPSDSAPLPPLELVEPPREPFPPLLPPTDPGPAPRAYGRLLRRALKVVDLPELFAPPEEQESEVADDAFLELGSEGDAKPALVPGGPKRSEDPYADERPDERAARIASYKKRYDWLQRGPGELWFGRIENDDRYGLEIDPERADEALLFVRLDERTGRELFEKIGAPPIPVERSTVNSFGFAETVANSIELDARRIGTQLTRTSYDEALFLGMRCIEARLQAPRALTVAEELYRRAAEYDPKDPLPRLGLARCLEAGFRFEDAFTAYQDLLQAFPHREEVHVRLAELEERFLLFDQAEARLREALTMNQSSWISRFGLGAFLARRGRFEEAVQHLKEANKAAPQAPELLGVRVAIRTRLADAHLALGELSEAEAAYRSALAADATQQRAQAGLLTTTLLSGKTLDAGGSAGGDAGFDLLLARGVTGLAQGEYAAALDALNLAAGADPLRAHQAFAAASVLAEVTGNGEDALRLADEALERDPTYAFALFQKGRLLGLQDDYNGARAALLGALEQELDFEDALVALGEMAFRLGRFEDAERYLERAVSLQDQRAEVHALRGLNLLRLNQAVPARASFERALALEKDQPTATAGFAWCEYLEGNSSEAMIQLGNIDEHRRNLPQDDPWRVWARTQQVRLREHLQKVEWRDTFSRKRLANEWQTREQCGPKVDMNDGTAEIVGSFDKNGATRLYRTYQGGEFLSIAADVFITPGKDNARIGLYAAREKPGRDEVEILAEASVSRHKEGNVQLRFRKATQLEAEQVDMKQAFPTGQWVRLKIERIGESGDATVTLFMDGIPLQERVPMPQLGQTNSAIVVGLFVEGELGREVAVRLDNVSIVLRKPQ